MLPHFFFKFSLQHFKDWILLNTFHRSVPEWRKMKTSPRCFVVRLFVCLFVCFFEFSKVNEKFQAEANGSPVRVSDFDRSLHRTIRQVDAQTHTDSNRELLAMELDEAPPNAKKKPTKPNKNKKEISPRPILHTSILWKTKKGKKKRKIKRKSSLDSVLLFFCLVRFFLWECVVFTSHQPERPSPNETPIKTEDRTRLACWPIKWSVFFLFFFRFLKRDQSHDVVPGPQSYPKALRFSEEKNIDSNAFNRSQVSIFPSLLPLKSTSTKLDFSKEDKMVRSLFFFVAQE